VTEDRKGERLAQVVVRAGVQSLGLVVLAVLRGEHEDRGGVAVRAQVGADPVAVAARQQNVEHDQVVGPLAGAPQPLEPVVGRLHREPLGGQSPAQGRGDLGVVLHDQQLHPGPPAHHDRRRGLNRG
jgi:hypothetical protein